MSDQNVDSAEIDAEGSADEKEEGAFEAGQEAISEGKEGGEDTLSDYESDFRDHIAGLGLQHFGFREFLFLGGSHYAPGNACFGRNALPPRTLWKNLEATAKVLDELRNRLGVPMRLNSIYRNKPYNDCLSGAAAESQHKLMRAVDFRASSGNPKQWRDVLLRMRNQEQLFKGGIGTYSTFVHVDTRGVNATWGITGV